MSVHDVFNRPFIEVSRGAEKKQYAKNEIFGLRMCDGHDYRLSANRLYRIVAQGDLFVYGVERPVTQGKGFRVAVSYYFSSGAGGEVRALTLEHLQEAFAARAIPIARSDRTRSRTPSSVLSFRARIHLDHRVPLDLLATI